MAVTAYDAFGSTLEVGAVTMAGLRDIGLDGRSRDSIEMGTHDSTNGLRDRLPGMGDHGEMSVSFVFDPGAASEIITGLSDQYDTKAAVAIVLTFPSATSRKMTANGFVSAFNYSANHDGGLMGDARITLTSAVAFAAAP